MSRITLAKPQLIKLTALNGDTCTLSDHNRDVLTVALTQIENKQRMADGTMRKYFTAAKRTFSTQWTNLPGQTSKTVDGKSGANDLQAFYFKHPEPITLSLYYSSGVQNYSVMFSTFENDLAKRGADDFYNTSFEVEEV